MTQSATSVPSETLSQLRENLLHHFNLDEFRTLCFDVGVDYDDLPGESKSGKARELITFLDRQGRLHDLIHRCAELRPRVWQHPSVPGNPLAEKPSLKATLAGDLSERISRSKPIQEDISNWNLLEQVLVRAVVAGGVAAMSYYRQALPQPFVLMEAMAEKKEDKNPSTMADLVATARILETVNAVLPSLVRPNRLDCMLSYLGEETKFNDWFEQHVSDNIPERVLPAPAFFSHYCEHNRLRVIVDGVDGTGSFMRGIPFFCSAAALLVEDEPRIAAVYDPIHHVVYSAILSGPHGDPESQSEAWAWEISTGNRLDLVAMAERRIQAVGKNLKKEAIGIHLTRTHKDKLHEFLMANPHTAFGALERLSKATGGVYALNCGILAMAHVATGGLVGFVNNVTNLWDIAAGEVLIRACKGKVTGFEGEPIHYNQVHFPSVVAASQLYHADILDILND